jgi:hypothetical protein
MEWCKKSDQANRWRPVLIHFQAEEIGKPRRLKIKLQEVNK